MQLIVAAAIEAALCGSPCGDGSVLTILQLAALHQPALLIPHRLAILKLAQGVPSLRSCSSNNTEEP